MTRGYDSVKELMEKATQAVDYSHNVGFPREERAIEATRAQALATMALVLATMQVKDGVYR